MRIAVCDDEQHHIEHMCDCLKQYSENHRKELQIQPYLSSKEFLTAATQEKFDIIFLDISMPEIDGLEAAHYIRKTDSEVHIVFATNLEEKMPQGYNVMAAGFLVKPFKMPDVRQIMNRLILLEERKNTAPYEIKLKGGGTVLLKLRDVLYFESLRHYIRAKTKTHEYEFRGKLALVYPELSKCGFIQTHRAYLVNMAYIWIASDDSILLTDSTTLPVGAKFSDKFREEFREYKRGG
ncbi:MAG: LytTR family DNA-binding domain-containing protein [Oscillospiraceae bacterium]|nr:LytTR family DNA-binding domain-containing protein [Oscillospiraceae bacterium]